MTPAVSIFIRLFLLIPLIGVLLLVAWAARKRGWILIVAVQMILILTASLALVGLRVSQVPSGACVSIGPSMPEMPAMPEMPSMPETPAIPGTPASPSRLLTAESPAPDFDEELHADTYPSARSGAVALTRRMLDSLDKLIPEGVKLGSLTIEGTGSPEVLAAVADAARSRLPGARVGMSGMPVSCPAGQVEATLRLNVVPISPTQTQISAQLAPGAGNGITDQVRTAEKPWLENLAALPPSNGCRFAVHSELAGSQQQATTEAIRSAVDRLRPIIENRLGAPFSPGHIRQPEEQWLSSRLWADLEHGPLARDRFEQKISKPYGQVWRHSLLVEIPEGKLNELTSDYLQGLTAERAGWKHTLLMAAGLAVGIVVLYLFLNAATKGYYTWTLRLAGAAAVAAGIVLVLKMA